MLRAHCQAAARICLLIAGVALTGTSAVAPASAHVPSVVLSPGSHESSAPAARPARTGQRPSPSKRAKCVVVRRAGKHHKARRSCVVKKAKTGPPRTGIARKRSRALHSPVPVVSSPSARTRTSKAPASETGFPPESPGGSSPPPIGPSTPDEPVAPSPIGKPVEPPSPAEPVAPVEPSAPFRFFSPTSFWNEEVPSNTERDPNSAAVVGAFDEEIAAEENAGNGPWINTTSYSVPVYTVPASQPMMPVRLYGATNTALGSAWSAVPLPSAAHPAVGADGDLFVWQPSTDRLWEFWRLQHEADGWQASWGGAMQDVSSEQGVYGSEAWPGAQPWWGVSASSLSLAGGLISIEDLERGQINHALEMAIPNVRAAVYASPAKRSDGKSTNPASLPEGAHLRVNPRLNLAALHLPRLTLIMAEAAQRYGIFIADRSSVATFYAEDPTPTGTNPYIGPSGFFEGNNLRQLLATFPWDQLELLKMQLHGGK